MNDSSKTILIVDDNPNFSFIWREFCESEGHRVVTAENAQDALALVESEPRIDLVMTDLVMPRMSGYEFIQQLRGLSETRHTPILLLTGSGKVIHDLAEKEGARMLSKSVDTDVVLRRIREALYPEGKPAAAAGDAAVAASGEPLYQIVHDHFEDFVPRKRVIAPWTPPSKES